MGYSYEILSFMGAGGILIHILMKIYSINSKMEGDINMRKFFKKAWPSFLSSAILVAMAVVAKDEVLAQKKTPFVLLLYGLIGLGSQSIIYFAMDRANKWFPSGKKNSCDEPPKDFDHP